MPTGIDLQHWQRKASESRAKQGLPPDTTEPAIVDRSLVAVLDGGGK